MSVFGDFEQRFGFPLPGEYRRMWDAGLLRRDDQDRTLRLSDTIWVTPGDPESCWLVEMQVPGLVPFAKSVSADNWSWFSGWRLSEAEPPVAHCPHDDRNATGYAPSFVGTVYRKLLEEMACSWLVRQLEITPSQLGDRFRRYADMVAPYFPQAWVVTLAGLAKRIPAADKWEQYGVLAENELNALIARDLAFPELEESFEQIVD